MSPDARSGGPAVQRENAPERPALRVHVVRYSDEPDRVTLSPRHVSDADHATTWLSVDADSVVSLADAR